MNEEQMQKQADIMDPQEVLGLMREVQELRLERDNLADRLGLRIGELNTAESQLATAVGVLRSIQSGVPLAGIHELVDAFLGCYAQGEQQEAQCAPPSLPSPPCEVLSMSNQLLPCPFCQGPAEEVEGKKSWFSCADNDCPAWHVQALAEEWNRRATQPAAGEPIGKVELFGINMTYVEWRDRKMPPLGTELYAAPPAAAHGEREITPEVAEQVFQQIQEEGGAIHVDEASLRLLAGNATQGEWWVDSHGHRMVSLENFETIFITHSEAMGPATRNQETGNLSHWRNDWDCSYIVAVQPNAILKLLNKLEVAYDLLASVPQHGPLAYPRFARIQQFLKTRPVSEGSI